MAFVKTDWVNGEGGGTPITATQLNRIEAGIADAVTVDATATATVAGVVKVASDTAQTVAASTVSATSARTYAVQKNAAGQLVVNVPWTAGAAYTLPAATVAVLGGVKLGASAVQVAALAPVSNTAGRTYISQVNADGQLVVNVPWEAGGAAPDVATTAALGTVKLVSATVQTVAASAPSTTASRTYPVQLNGDQQMVVNVPWQNTTYTLTAASLADVGGVKQAERVSDATNEIDLVVRFNDLLLALKTAGLMSN